MRHKTYLLSLVLYDSSKTMGQHLGNTGKRKVEAQKQILKERNEALPDLKWNAGLYTFTPGAGRLGRRVLKAYYEVKPYNKEAFILRVRKSNILSTLPF